MACVRMGPVRVGAMLLRCLEKHVARPTVDMLLQAEAWHPSYGVRSHGARSSGCHASTLFGEACGAANSGHASASRSMAPGRKQKRGARRADDEVAGEEVFMCAPRTGRTTVGRSAGRGFGTRNLRAFEVPELAAAAASGSQRPVAAAGGNARQEADAPGWPWMAMDRCGRSAGGRRGWPASRWRADGASLAAGQWVTPRPTAGRGPARPAGRRRSRSSRRRSRRNGRPSLGLRMPRPCRPTRRC